MAIRHVRYIRDRAWNGGGWTPETKCWRFARFRSVIWGGAGRDRGSESRMPGTYRQRRAGREPISPLVSISLAGGGQAGAFYR